MTTVPKVESDNQDDKKKSDYILGAGSLDDRDRLIIQHEIFKPHFVALIQQVLDEYGLAERLTQAKAAGNRLHILDVGCGEGMFLHDVAAILEERGLLEAAVLHGLDRDASAIKMAQDISEQVTPTRPYLNFYVQDVKAPLENNMVLQAAFGTDPLEFDFIYAWVVMEHVAGARAVLERLFTQNFRAKGVILLRDGVTHEGQDGWLSFHPALSELGQVLQGAVAQLNGGVDVATTQSSWLAALGAKDIQVKTTRLVVGGETTEGRQLLHDALLAFLGSGPVLVERGLLRQSELDEVMSAFSIKQAPHLQGQITLIDTLALKD